MGGPVYLLYSLFGAEPAAPVTSAVSFATLHIEIGLGL